MKTYLFFFLLGLTLTGNTIFAATAVTPFNYNRHQPITAKKKQHIFFNHQNNVLKTDSGSTGVEPHLRLQLAQDSILTDDIYIGFDPGAQTQYVFNEDAPYFQGYGRISIASISSDNIKLSINRLPLPKPSETIKIYIDAAQDGIYSLNMTEDAGIPPLYEVWLMDAYKKDSLDIGHNPTYAFNILKSDTNSYGSGRFSLVIRENPALGVHLLNFAAAKSSAGAQVTWETENEQDYTNFTIERSINGGLTYTTLGGFTSSTIGTYSYLDKNPANTANQYRLKIEDLNGTISYSGIVTLLYGNSTANNMMVYPNPSASVINVAVNAISSSSSSLYVSASVNPANSTTSSQNSGAVSYNIKIINISGAVIKTSTSSQATWQANVSSLAPGTYIIQVLNNVDNSLIGKSTFIKM